VSPVRPLPQGWPAAGRLVQTPSKTGGEVERSTGQYSSSGQASGNASLHGAPLATGATQTYEAPVAETVSSWQAAPGTQYGPLATSQAAPTGAAKAAFTSSQAPFLPAASSLPTQIRPPTHSMPPPHSPPLPTFAPHFPDKQESPDEHCSSSAQASVALRFGAQLPGQTEPASQKKSRAHSAPTVHASPVLPVPA
jgi:hypothetical protein